VCATEEIDELITDDAADDDELEAIRSLGVDVTVVPAPEETRR
jgi:DeoR/GlpR family transcriptional regulator of sugar metabolism